MTKLAFCMKCKTKREVVQAEEIMMRNSRPALRGRCVECNTVVFAILPMKKKKDK